MDSASRFPVESLDGDGRGLGLMSAPFSRARHLELAQVIGQTDDALGSLHPGTPEEKSARREESPGEKAHFKAI